ncbi:MAG: phage tail protein [Ignavibacteria bacterium]|nr:phage tail protein [Ignavibacteria bacterium]
MTFALITEGVSEHKIVKHIISKYFKDLDPNINQIQPQLLDDKQDTPGGWNEVLNYCAKDELKDILIENDYLVIQIDSDQSETFPFSIPHTNSEGQVKLPQDIHTDIINKLSSEIKKEILANYKDKIFFAICIHTIECWLLPLYYTDNRKTKILNCVDTLNQILPRKGLKPINNKEKNSPNSVTTYNEILKSLKKKSEIVSTSDHNIGFQYFINSLATILMNNDLEN